MAVVDNIGIATATAIRITGRGRTTAVEVATSSLPR